MIRTPLLSVSLALLALCATAPAARARQTKEIPEEIKKIRQFYHSYKDEEALAACNEWLVNHPGDPAILETRARCLRELGRIDDAVKSLRTIKQPAARIRLLLAECLVMTKDGGAEATQIVDEVAADDPNAVEPRITRARVYLAQGKLKEASSELQYVRTTAPKNFEAALLMATVADLGGQVDQAQALLLQLVKKPGDFQVGDIHLQRDAVAGLAQAYVKLQRYDEAIELYTQMVDHFEGQPVWLAQLALCQSMRERFADAITNLEKAVELAPSVVEFRWRLATLYRSQGRTDDAIAQFEAILASGQAQVLAELRLGELYLEKGLLDKAKLHVDQSLTLAPDSADVFEVNARLREKLGDQPGAKEFYRKAFALNPLKFDALYHLALLLSRSTDAAEQAEGQQLLARHKKVEQFLRDIERTKNEAEINPRSPLLMTRMAGLLNLAGEYEHAKVWAERSEKLDPRSLSTYVQLGYIAANMGDNAAALKYFEKAVKMLGQNKVEKLDEYIEKLKKGEPLALPLGEYGRPAQKQPGDAPAPASGNTPVPSGNK